MQSKLYGWRQKEYDPKDPDGTGGEGTESSPTLTGLRKVKKPVEVKVEEKEPVVEVAKVEPPPAVTHVLTIDNGGYEQRVIFIKNDKGEWGRATAVRLRPTR